MEKLTEDDQLVFFYHKCKCNTTFNSLAVHYDLPPAYLSQAFENVEQILFVHAEENIWFLSEEQNKLTMPESFQKNYPQCSGIIDCFEIKTEVPSRVDQAILAFSNYKKGFTIKRYWFALHLVDLFSLLVKDLVEEQLMVRLQFRLDFCPL